MEFNELLKIGKSRRSTKKFNQELVSIEDLNKIFEFANTAPSSVGLELWRAIVIDGELKNELSEKAFRDYNINRVNTASHLVILVTKKQEYFSKDNKNYLDRIEANTRYNRSQFGAETSQEDIDNAVNGLFASDHGNNNFNYEEWSARSAYIVLPYILLGAESLGIKSLTMEGFTSELTKILIEKELIDSDERATLGVVLGYSEGIEGTTIGKEQHRTPVEQQFKFIK